MKLFFAGCCAIVSLGLIQDCPPASGIPHDDSAANARFVQERSVRFLIRRGGDPIQPGIKREFGLIMVDDADASDEAQSHGGLPAFPIVMNLKYTDVNDQLTEKRFYSKYRC